LLLAPGAGAVSLEPVGSFDRPIYVTSDPQDPDRLFVVEREGRIQLHEDGATSEMADLTSLVLCCESEQGLHSLAVAPDFETSGLIYVVYTGTVAAGSAAGDVHVDAFEVSGDTIALGTRRPILTVDHSSWPNHNGGQLHFGPDGHLYVSLGDGGGPGDPGDNAQDLGTLAGSLLRIDPRPDEEPPAYAIPEGNPFVEEGDPGLGEIWAYGLRNPWRFSFDRETGDMVIADVGQGEREEIDFAPTLGDGGVGGAGANYGWDCWEGLIEYTGPPDAPSPLCGGGPFVDPIFDYPHTPDVDAENENNRCSITGGYVVRDPSVEELYGRYLYGDLCVGQLRSIDLSEDNPASTDQAEAGLAVPPFALHSFGEDSCGRVYVASNEGEPEVAGDDVVYRLTGDQPADCDEPDPKEEEEPAQGKEPGGSDEPPVTRPPNRFAIRAQRRVRRGARALVVVRAAPCPRNRGKIVALRRGGRPIARKRLNRGCFTRFHPKVWRNSSYRALLWIRKGSPLWSKRAVIRVRQASLRR